MQLSIHAGARSLIRFALAIFLLSVGISAEESHKGKLVTYADRDKLPKLLQGKWRGKIDVREKVQADCFVSERSYHFDVLLQVFDKETPRQSETYRKISMVGTLKIDHPLDKISESCQSFMPGLEPITLKIPQAQVRGVGMISQGNLYINDPWVGAPERPYYAVESDSGVENESREIEDYHFPMVIQSFSTDEFVTGNDPSGERLTQEMIHKSKGSQYSAIDAKGKFRRVGALEKSIELPAQRADNRRLAKLLAALAAYLALLLPGIVKNPKASDFVSLMATLIGSLDTLKGLGFEKIAAQARLGGFVGAAMAEAVELVRIYKTSTHAGESAGVTAMRLAISAMSDIGAFAAGVVIVEAGIGAAVGGVSVVGPVGAAVVAVGGAALLTYGLSQATTAVKARATEILDRFLGK